MFMFYTLHITILCWYNARTLLASFWHPLNFVLVCSRPPDRQWISLQPDRPRNPACKLFSCLPRCYLNKWIQFVFERKEIHAVTLQSGIIYTFKICCWISEVFKLIHCLLSLSWALTKTNCARIMSSWYICNMYLLIWVWLLLHCFFCKCNTVT